MLENKDIWDQFLKDSDESSDSGGKTSAEHALDPGYRTEDKPTTFDLPKERIIDIDATSEDIHEQAAAIVHNTVGAAPAPKEKADTAETNRAAVSPNTTLPSNTRPGDHLGDESDAMREMTAAMRELTEELRYFRTQMGARSDRKPSTVSPSHARSDETTSGETETTAATEATGGKKKTNKALSVISNILFYVVIVAMVAGAFLLKSTGKGQPFMLGGISAANVLTSSMEDVYPRGSLIITKTVDPSELEIGDDITFMVSEDTSITHRIIKVSKDPVSGDYMFTTKGTNNQKADEDPVSQANVVGKVIFSSKFLGDTANFIKSNWPILIFVLIVIIALISFLKWNAKKGYSDEQKNEEDNEEKRSKVKKEKPISHMKKRSRVAEGRTAKNEHEET